MRRPLIVSLLVLFVCVAEGLFSQDLPTDQVYRVPPEELVEVVDAPFTPEFSVAPDRENALILYRAGLPGIEEVSQPELRLAGLRINPRTNGPSRSWYYNGLVLRSLAGEQERPVTGLPDEPRISDVSWSPDGRTVAMVLTFADRMELWTVDVETARAASALKSPVNASYGDPYVWLPDSREILTLTLPADRPAPPSPPVKPRGPVIQQNLGRAAPARTYQDLLENEHDEALFRYYATSRIMQVGLQGEATPVGPVGIYSRVDPSPSGEYLLVEETLEPFSYTVPASRFPERVAVWDRNGRVAHTVAELPLADDVPIPFGSVRTGPRSANWRSDSGATLCWVEALDGGDAGVEAELRDQLFLLEAPFDTAPLKLLTLDHRYDRIDWSRDDLALVSGWWWQTRNQKVWRVYPGSPERQAEVVMEYSWEDRYNDPGTPMLEPNERGKPVLVTADGGETLFLKGEGASPEGDRPFLDAWRIDRNEKERLFRSEAPYFEQPVLLIDARERVLLTLRESAEVQPNFWRRSLREEEKAEQITSFPHPNPQFAGVHKELIRYQRADGVDLTATLYLPAGYDSERDGALPMLMWAYPQEFKSADAAGQVTDSPHRFVRVTYWSPMLWLLRGYAVLDDPTMPIVGEGVQEPNDSFVEQLVSSAQAAVDEVVRRGVADRSRIAIGGHSYGAFMTANLLAHSDLYRAGIARSGAYNRTLTPFGFQTEERTLWEAPEVYFRMSPFMHAQKINEPILLIHGAADNNSGTFPLQSDRMFGALKGLGATVRFVMLPFESHGYRARESILHMLYEMSEWVDRYVNEAPARQ